MQYLVALCSAGVMYGWIYDYPPLTTFFLGGVTEKFSTAVMFLCASLGFAHWNWVRSMAVGGLLTAWVLSAGGFTRPFESLDKALETVSPGEPSWGTMLAFAIVAFYLGEGRVGLFKFRELWQALALLAGVAVVGHILKIPPLYYYFEGWSTGMASATAVQFLMLAWVIRNDRIT